MKYHSSPNGHRVENLLCEKLEMPHNLSRDEVKLLRLTLQATCDRSPGKTDEKLWKHSINMRAMLAKSDDECGRFLELMER